MHKTTHHSKLIKIVTVVFVILLIGIIVIANLGLGPVAFAFLDYIPGGDKTGHFVLIGLLSLFVNLSMGIKTTSLKYITVLKGSLIISILVFAEELSQLFLKHRGFDLLDLTFDAAGIVLFGRLAKSIYKTDPTSERT